MGFSIFGSPPKPAGFENWQDWAASLADYLELQGSLLAELSLTGLAATPTILGFQSIAAITVATALTVPAGTVVAYIQVEGQAVRWRDDGTNPTSVAGLILNPGDPLLMYSGRLSNLKFIQK